MPTTRPDFWAKKFDSNVIRDGANVSALVMLGWRVAIVWECSVRAAEKAGDPKLSESLASWLKGKSDTFKEF